MTDFRKELQSLLNKHSKENGSDTPDWILADYLTDCLASFDLATQRREKWYGRIDTVAACLDPPTETTSQSHEKDQS